MSLTYSDFPYYPLGEREGGSAITSTRSSYSGLPDEIQVLEETTVPLLQNTEDVNRDFIIIAEFSELEGPTPLCTIPIDAADKTDIKLNTLAVHLMSTDYQVNTVGQFKMCEDTQVMRTNVFKNVHVFMQYFTLYDIKARGFVRPFCFGYVSKDHVKIERYVPKFAAEFDKVTNILKHTNRQWFSAELQKYLEKLKTAKEEYIQAKSQSKWQSFSPILREKEGEPEVFTLEDSDDDSVSLNQLANQFTEIEAILQTIKNTKVDVNCESEINLLSFHIQHLQQKNRLKVLLENFHIYHPYFGDASVVDEYFEKLKIPLVHPLKQKGESLRPLTTLGQLGTIMLIWRLMRLELQKRPDFIFLEMNTVARDYKKHCKFHEGRQSPLFEASVDTVVSDRTVLHDCATDIKHGGAMGANGDYTEDDSGDEEGEDEQFQLLQNNELYIVLEKIHDAVAIVPDNKSGSYHSLSDVSDGMVASGNENESSCYNSAVGSTESQNIAVVPNITLNDPESLNPQEAYSSSAAAIFPSSEARQLRRHSTTCVDKIRKREEKANIRSTSFFFDKGSETRISVSSFSSSDDDFSFSGESNEFSDAESAEIIEKTGWYVMMTKQLTKGSPGYGILKFFRHFVHVAHHVVYSIIMGRPVVICGSESCKPRISQILSALIPLVPCYPERCWKLLRWHRGILIPVHFKHNSFKLIGLCIPERLVVQDLMRAEDVNSVTILNVETKRILGPAYSGIFFSNFEQKCQTYFHDDRSLMGYLGCIFVDVETKVFLYKALVSSGTKPKDASRQLELNAADNDIVKHLAGLIQDTSNVVDIF